MRYFEIMSEVYYRGTRDEPERSARPSMSFTDDKDVANVYAASPKTGDYVPGSRVSKANFEMKKPVDLSREMMMDLNTALGEVGVMDPSERVDDVLMLINGLRQMEERGHPFHHKIINGLDWDELLSAVRKSAAREDWDRFFNLLDYTSVDTYALCDTKTFVRLAKEHGFDGIIHMDSFDAGAKVGNKLLGKQMGNSHLTYRPFGDVNWGV